MVKKKLNDAFWFCARIFLGLLYAYAGFVKVTGPVEEFHAAILAYGVFPYDFARWVAMVLPWFEIVAGVFLILGYVPRVAAMSCSLFSLSFLVLFGVTYLKFGELPADCGCFGGLMHLKPYQLILLDMFSFLVGLRLASFKRHILSLDKLLNSEK